MALTVGHAWSQSALLDHSNTDEISPIYPDRPIRPLPKRKLRSRLSSEQACAISYPPTVSNSSPLFGSPHSQSSRGGIQGSIDLPVEACDGHENIPCECGGDHGSDLDSEEESNTRPRSRKDGYESFENTNNKKKRKIPLSVVSTMISAESTPPMPSENGLDAYNESSTDKSFPQVIRPQTPPSLSPSTFAKSRFVRSQARTLSERRPLTATSSLLDAPTNGHLNRMKRDWNSASTQAELGSSRDIPLPQTDQFVADRSQKTVRSPAASAAAVHVYGSASASEKRNQSFFAGQHTSREGKDFTFECKSPSSSRMGLPQRTAAANNASRALLASDKIQQFATHGTQTSPRTNGKNVAAPTKSIDRAQALPIRSSHRKTRKSDQEYAVAARQRQMQQDISNYHHPPKKEDIWICEFCEYEAIWGKPPVALVRQYEIKDRKERKAAEERRRLLEKAKAKGRKNKKSGKSTKATGTQGTNPSQGYDLPYDDSTPQDHDSQGEEFFDDGYDEDGSASGQRMSYEDDLGYEANSYVRAPHLNDY